MKSYVESLAILLTAQGACHCSKAHRAAGHLVAAQVVKSDPTPEPAVCDAEMRALYAEMGREVLLRAPMVQYR